MKRRVFCPVAGGSVGCVTSDSVCSGLGHAPRVLQHRAALFCRSLRSGRAQTGRIQPDFSNPATTLVSKKMPGIFDEADDEEILVNVRGEDGIVHRFDVRVDISIHARPLNPMEA